jgi:3-oxoacid CoA-transferase
MMAAAGKICIAEVEELVAPGELDPNCIHVPGIYVQRIFQGTGYEKRIEQRILSLSETTDPNESDYFEYGKGLTKYGIARRISKEIKDGYYVNLGIGIPTLVANYIPKDISIMLQSENGLLGIGPFPAEDEVDPDLINAGKQTITMQKGSALFNSAESFAMIRGEHVDLTILGAMEVSENGDIANWKIPGKMVKGMGGAMDLVASAKNIIVAMQHVSKGLRCVKKIVTELAVIDVLPEGGLILTELAPGVSVQQVIEATEAPLKIADGVKEMEF